MSPLALSLRLLQAQPDERLLALARGGHEPAFEALVRRYRRQLLAYCRKLAAPQANAEDILQQALMQAWTALASGVEVRDARAWLYRIVHNAAISATRKAGEDSAQLSHDLSAVEVERVVEQRLAAREALAGVAALPELQRQVILGTAVEGRSHEEVAASLGLTSGSVRGLLYRARSTLRAAAAALIPSPMIEWATRQEPGGRGAASGILEGVAGGGSAGVAGAVLKGGAAVTVAGALAGTAAVVVTHRFHLLPERARGAIVHTATAKRRIVAVISGPRAVDAAARDGAAPGTAGSAARTRLEPVVLRVSDRHVRSSIATVRIDTRQPLGRAVSRSDRPGSHRAGEGNRGSGQSRSDGGAGSRPTDHQGTGSTTSTGGGDHFHHGSDGPGSGDRATAASAAPGDQASAWGDASRTRGDGTGTRGDASRTRGDTTGTQGNASGARGDANAVQAGASGAQVNASGAQVIASGALGSDASASQTASGTAAAGSQGTSTTTTQSSQPAPPAGTNTP